MEHGVPLSDLARADDPEVDSVRRDDTHEVAKDLAYKRLAIVNVVFFGLAGAADREWVLIDTGLPGTAGSIVRAASKRFGEKVCPSAIILTHGHFDHTSELKELAEWWDVPIYAHPLEHPYLNGEKAYPPADPSVGGGLMSAMSPAFPRGPIDVSKRLHALPEDGTVPGMPGWIWIHTPGHTPGHVSFWRELDRSLIAGDAFITTDQESVYAAVTQRPELHGPPMYLTTDWVAAKDSVERLARLDPEIAITGHGRAMAGHELRQALHALADDFDRLAVPEQGRYVDRLTPAQPEPGDTRMAEMDEDEAADVESEPIGLA